MGWEMSSRLEVARYASAANRHEGSEVCERHCPPCAGWRDGQRSQTERTKWAICRAIFGGGWTSPSPSPLRFEALQTQRRHLVGWATTVSDTRRRAPWRGQHSRLVSIVSGQVRNRPAIMRPSESRERP